MNYSVRNIFIAVGLAACAVVAVLVYTANFQSSVRQDQQRIDVLVAARDVPAGTAVASLQSGGLLSHTKVVRADALPGALTAATLAAHKSSDITSQELFAGEQVSAQIFDTPTSQPADIRIAKTQRALQIPIDPNAGVVGTIRSGDNVDIYMAVKITNAKGTETPVTRPLLRNVEVLRSADAPGASSQGGDHVLLRVTDLQASKVLWGQQNATLWFVVRPKAGAKDSPNSLETVQSMLLDGLNPTQVKALRNKSEFKAG